MKRWCCHHRRRPIRCRTPKSCAPGRRLHPASPAGTEMTAAVERASAIRCIGRFIAAPVRDYIVALEAIRSHGSAARRSREDRNLGHSREGGDGKFQLLKAGLAFVVSWFLYVPTHELLHAFGCLWTGGTVTRL